QSPATLLLLAAVLAGMKEVPLAVEVLRQAQRRNSGDLWVNHNLSEYLMLLKPPLTGDAVAFMRVAVALRPEMPLLRPNLGYVLRRHGRFREDEEECRKAIQLKPDYAQAYLNLGVALGDQKRNPDEVIAAYRKALALKPDYPDAYYNLGITFRKLGRFREA